jgi:hypothetical protein
LSPVDGIPNVSFAELSIALLDILLLPSIPGEILRELRLLESSASIEDFLEDVLDELLLLFFFSRSVAADIASISGASSSSTSSSFFKSSPLRANVPNSAS